MRDYTKIQAWKLADDFTVAVYQAVFRCLHGLIQAVERESGRLSKWSALFTSAIALVLSRLITAG